MSIFKVGDKVYHMKYGWGTVKKVDEMISVIFTHDIVTFIEGRLLSFTEYTLQGFTQERPIQLPEFGELCLMSTSLEPTNNWDLVHFGRYGNSEVAYRFESMNGGYYAQMKRIKILD